MRNVLVWCFTIVFISGNLIGLSIGYVPVIIQSYADGTDCGYKGIQSSKDDCTWADDAICTWVGGDNNTCEFTAVVQNGPNCDGILDSAECEAQSEWCVWTQTASEKKKTCQFQKGWPQTKTALVAAMSTIGGLVASLFVNIFITRAGVNNTISFAGMISTVACILLTAGWHSYDDELRVGLILAGRFLSGFCIALASAAVPIYIGDVAPRENAGVLGVGFQVFITFGIMCAALAGFAANPNFDNLHPRTGVAALNIYQLVLSVFLIPAGYFAEKPLFDDSVRNSLLTFRHSAFLRIDPTGKDSPLSALNESASLFKRPLYVAVAILIAAGQQFSGINALMAYSSQMAADIGLENPFLATFIVNIWNFVSTLMAIYLAYRMTAGNMFLLGEFVAAISCFVVAVPIYFYNTQDDTPQGFIITGVMLFIFAFEFGMGPSFYVLAQSMFPSEIRSAGCSFTIFCQFFCNLIVQFLYPILVTSFSGGSSEPKDKGIGIMFFIYGGVGLILTLALKRVMRMIKDELVDPGEEISGGVETRDHLTQY